MNLTVGGDTQDIYFILKSQFEAHILCTGGTTPHYGNNRGLN